jgi:hypothetical protein
LFVVRGRWTVDSGQEAVKTTLLGAGLTTPPMPGPKVSCWTPALRRNQDRLKPGLVRLQVEWVCGVKAPTEVWSEPRVRM